MPCWVSVLCQIQHLYAGIVYFPLKARCHLHSSGFHQSYFPSVPPEKLKLHSTAVSVNSHRNRNWIPEGNPAPWWKLDEMGSQAWGAGGRGHWIIFVGTKLHQVSVKSSRKKGTLNNPSLCDPSGGGSFLTRDLVRFDWQKLSHSSGARMAGKSI